MPGTLIHHKDLNDTRIIIPTLQVGKLTPRRVGGLSPALQLVSRARVHPQVGLMAQPAIRTTALCSSPHEWFQPPWWPGRMELRAEAGVSRPPFLSGVWRVRSHYWPRVDLLPSATCPNQGQHRLSSHSSEAVREGWLRGPIHLCGMDSLLELSHEALLPGLAEQGSRWSPLKGEMEATPGKPCEPSSSPELSRTIERKTGTFSPTRVFCMLYTCCCVSFI